MNNERSNQEGGFGGGNGNNGSGNLMGEAERMMGGGNEQNSMSGAGKEGMGGQQSSGGSNMEDTMINQGELICFLLEPSLHMGGEGGLFLKTSNIHHLVPRRIDLRLQQYKLLTLISRKS